MGGLAGSSQAIGIGDAVWRIGADLSNLHRQLGEAQRSVGQTMQNVGRQAQQIGKAFTVVGGAITGSLGLMTRSFLKTGDQLNKMSARTGIAVEALDEMRFALEQNGSSLEDFENAVRRMQRNLVDAERGTGQAAEALQTLGLSVDDLLQRNPDDQFMAIADALSRVDDATRRSAMAQDIFGRSATSLLPLIQQGADGINEYREELREMGGMSTEAAQKAADFSDALDKLQEVLKPVKDFIAETIVDALEPWVEKATEIVQKIRDWMDENEELVATIVKITGVVGLLLLGLGPLLIVFGSLIASLGGILVAGKVAAAAGLIPLIAVFAAVGVGAVILYKVIKDNWDDIRDWTVRTWNRIKAFLERNWETIQDLGEATGRALTSAFKAAWQAIKILGDFISMFFLGYMISLDKESGELNKTYTGEDGLIASMETFTGWLETAADRMDQWGRGIRIFRAIMREAWDDITERTAKMWAWLDRVKNVLDWLGKWRPGPMFRRFVVAGGKQLLGFARGGRVGQQANIIAGEEGPELADLPGGRRVLLGSYGPGMYQVPIGTYIHKFADTMRMLASGAPFAGMYASGGTVQTVGYLEKIRDILSRLRVLGMARLPQQDQNDFWRASQEAWLRARQAVNPVVHQDMFGFGARDGRSYAGALQGSGGWLRASQRQGTGGVLSEMFRFARGGRVTGSMATPAGVVVNVNMAEMVVREQADIDRISEQIAARVNRIVRQL